jgi:ABC-type transport system involved in cytochrome bd biosynthesis fused ATPase/permease subunit
VSQTPVMLSADQLQMGVMHSSAVLFNTETTSVLDLQLLSFQVLDFLQDFILLSLGNVEWL